MHFFTSHFFTTLVNEGPEGVSSWTTKREIKIFEKKFIFIPINERLHWSLCVVVNPGKIRNRFRQDKLDDDQVPCLLFFDSLKAHKKQRIGRNIREWLNFECNRLRYVSDITDSQAPFDEKTMVLYDPKGTFSLYHYNTIIFDININISNSPVPGK
jgi:Ulp1 family protease